MKASFLQYFYDIYFSCFQRKICFGKTEDEKLTPLDEILLNSSKVSTVYRQAGVN